MSSSPLDTAQYRLLNEDGTTGAYYRKTLQLYNDGVVYEGLEFYASTESWRGSTDPDRNGLMTKLIPIDGVPLEPVAYDRATREKLAENGNQYVNRFSETKRPGFSV